MRLIFEQIRAGGDRNFGYLLADRGAREAILIDPSYSPDVFIQRATEQDVAVSHILNTHSHPDHVNGNARARELTGARLAAHVDSPESPDAGLRDGSELTVGALRLQFFHVPGHCHDHLAVYEPTYQILITGDLLFVGKVGGTRSDEDATTEWESLRRLLAAVPGSATVWPGHDYGVRPSSTVALEQQTNPFLLCGDLPAFLKLKRDWAAYKTQYGLK